MFNYDNYTGLNSRRKVYFGSSHVFPLFSINNIHRVLYSALFWNCLKINFKKQLQKVF